MAQNKKAAARTSAAKEILKAQFTGNAAAAQRGRALAHLRQHGSLSTLDARRPLMHGAIHGAMPRDLSCAARG
jgi:hypothetical protein